jgi:transposase
MRGADDRTGELFSYVSLEARVRGDHPLRAIRLIVNEAPAGLEHEFSGLYSRIGRPSIAPEQLLRAMLLQAFYSIRSERQLMERLDYDLLFRWFVGIGVDMRSGSIRPSPRTASGCSTAISRPSSSARCWRGRG